MNAVTVSPLLRWALAIDAIASAATGLVMSLFATPLSTLLQLPQGLLLGAGLFCIGYAAVIGAMSRRHRLPRLGVQVVIIGNALWALECVLLATIDGLQPSAVGVAFLLFQAAVVGGFAALQALGLQRAPLTATIAGSR